MKDELLKKAREYEEINERMVSPEERPLFHLSPRVGWMNDPNGFSYYNGRYHLFYQYYPYDTEWGLMHWGHAVSKDLLHWEYLPAALAPGEDYDADGVFSGSAVSLDDGRQLLMYTGVKKTETDQGEKWQQTQCIALGDGTDYEKYTENPVIGADKLPSGCDGFEFRDPKIWREEDGSFSCIAGNLSLEGSGQILLFKSSNGFEWSFKSILSENKGRFGKMWECPDFFELDGKHVLLVSPQFMLAEGYDYYSGNGTVCFIGEYDKENGRFTEEYDQTIDHGPDLYAPQTILTSDGRRVMIGWMQNWDSCALRQEDSKIFGQMCLPRELHILNGRLIQNPVRELDELHSDRVCIKDAEVSSERISFEGISGRTLDMELTVKSRPGKDPFESFTMRFAENERFSTSLTFETGKQLLTLDRTYSGLRRAVLCKRECRLRSYPGKLKLRIVLDRYSVEVFVNDGEQVMTMTFFTDLTVDGISFEIKGEAVLNIEKFTIP